jgi:hypothetical protein
MFTSQIVFLIFKPLIRFNKFKNLKMGFIFLTILTLLITVLFLPLILKNILKKIDFKIKMNNFFDFSNIKFKDKIKDPKYNEI